MRRVLALAALAAGLTGCAQTPRAALPFDTDPAWPLAELLLLGEQHDAPEHQRLAARVVEHLAAEGRLAALALEMAERGRSTRGLPPGAGEAAVRDALAWDERGWPWPAYGPIVMTAVRAGVPVLGANLPRAATRDTMRDASVDALVGAALRQQLQDDVRDGHCGLLPESQLAPMTRVQIARDRAMAETLLGLLQPGRTVLLVAGSAHVDASRGVPQQLRRLAPSGVALRGVRLAAGAAPGARSPGFDETWPTPAVPPVDRCAGLAGKLGPAR